MRAPPPNAPSGKSKTGPFDLTGDAALGMMQHLPTILKVARQVPGLMVGFVLTLLYMLAWVGRQSFKDSIAPVGGFHLFALALARELVQPLRTGQERAAELRRRQDAQKSFHSDIAMQYREKLD